MQNNSEEAPQTEQQAPTHYAVPAELFAAVAKVLMAQPYGEVEPVMLAYKRCHGLTITPKGPQSLPPGVLSGRGVPEEG